MPIRHYLALTLLAGLLALCFRSSAAWGEESMDASAAGRPDFDALWDYSNTAATREKFLAVLEQVQASAPPDYLAQLYSQIARTYSLEGSFDQGYEWIAKGEALCAAAPDDPAFALARVRLLLERGRCLNSSAQAPASVPLFKEAAELAEAIGEAGYAMDALHMLGIAEPGEAGLEWNLKAIALAEGSSDERARKWLGALYNNTGWAYQESGRPEQALALFEKGVEVRRQSGKQPYLRMAEYAYARALRELSRYSEALAIQERLQAEYSADGSADGYVYEELAELYLHDGRAEAARDCFAKAYELLKEDSWMVKDQAERLARIKSEAGL